MHEVVRALRWQRVAAPFPWVREIRLLSTSILSKDPGHIRGALDYISDPAYWKKINIEEESYVPLVLFRYGKPATAYDPQQVVVSCGVACPAAKGPRSPVRGH